MSEQPQRIQRKRVKGWKMPPNTISVTRPGIYGNPYRLNDPRWGNIKTAAESVERYRQLLARRKENEGEAFEKWIARLRGKNLACFCEIGKPCHADLLLEIANETAAEIDPAASE